TGPTPTETLARSHPRRVLTESVSAAAGFDTNHFHVRIAEKFVKQADGIRAAANTGEKIRGQALLRSKYLLARFAANHRLKIPDHRGIRMCAQNRSEQIVRASHVGDPIAHRFVDGIFQRSTARFHPYDLRANHAHARN